MDRHVLLDADLALMDELARLLGHERRLLELLLFKLVEGKHLLAAGEARFLPYAAAEVERAMERLQEAELRRSLLVHRLAEDLELPEEALTMSALAKDSLEPYRTIFADHRQAFLDLASEIEEVTRQNRRLAERGSHNVEQLMAMLGQPGPAAPELKLYGPAAGLRPAVAQRQPATVPHRFDGAI
jgi:hypothetical protein